MIDASLRLNLGDIAHRAAERHGRVPVRLDRPLDVAPNAGVEHDFVTLAALVDELAACLWAAGLRPGDVVAVHKALNFDVLLLACAAARIGGVPALLSPQLGGESVRTLLHRLGRPTLVSDAPTLAADGLGPRELKAFTCAVVADAPGGIALDELRGGRAQAPRLKRGEEPAIVTQTSGTTGTPKLVQHSVRSLAAVASLEARRKPVAGFVDSDVGAVCISWFHGRAASGLIAWLSRGVRVLPMSVSDPDHVAGFLAQHRPSVIEAHPNVFLRWEALAEHPDAPFARVRMFFNTFDAIHPRTIRRLLGASRRRFALFVQAYAQTEAGVITYQAYSRGSFGDRRVRAGAGRNVGRPIPFANRVRIVDAVSGRPLPRGARGLIQVRGPGLAMTYVGDEEGHRAKRAGDWWTTGDVGLLRRSGRLELLDREVDQLPGLESCIAAEDILLERLPELTEVVIVGDATGADDPVPVVCTAGDAALARTRWVDATADLPRLAPPVQLAWDAVPRTSTWKVRRSQLRRLLDARGAPASHALSAVDALG